MPGRRSGARGRAEPEAVTTAEHLLEPPHRRQLEKLVSALRMNDTVTASMCHAALRPVPDHTLFIWSLTLCGSAAALPSARRLLTEARIAVLAEAAASLSGWGAHFGPGAPAAVLAHVAGLDPAGARMFTGTRDSRLLAQAAMAATSRLLRAAYPQPPLPLLRTWTDRVSAHLATAA